MNTSQAEVLLRIDLEVWRQLKAIIRSVSHS